jgi:hypothetical protein
VKGRLALLGLALGAAGCGDAMVPEMVDAGDGAAPDPLDAGPAHDVAPLVDAAIDSDAAPPTSCRRAIGRVAADSHVLRFEASAPAMRVHLLRRNTGPGIGESYLYDLTAMWIERDGVCTPILEKGQLGYINSHHNWRDVATAVAGGLEHRLALSYDYDQGGWHFELGITEMASGRVVLAPTALVATGAPVGQWYGPGAVLVYVSEVMPDNRTTWKDEAGDYDPWIELFNPSSEAVDLSGYFLSNDPQMRKLWVFPAGTLIGRHENLVVVGDNQPAQGPLHASFRLAATGGVVLTAPSGVTNGERAYTAVPADHSLVFSHDSDSLEPSATPTPGSGGF